MPSYAYTLGLAGNRTQVMEAGPATTWRTVNYTYDAVYRLTQEQIHEPGIVSVQSFNYGYDAVGNRTQMTRNGVVTSYTYDANDRLLTELNNSTGTTASSYNDSGNLKRRVSSGGTESYVYDSENRLVSASNANGLVSYAYDTDGMRTSKTSGGLTTSFLLDKNRDYAQVPVETTGTSMVTYTYGNQLINQTRTGVGTHFYTADGQLSTRQLTNSTGVVTDQYTYDAFGVMLASIGITPNAYLYTGEQYDPNVGFYYMRARYYDQAQGRFISTDSEEGNIFDPVSLHRYLYAKADPMDNRDPSGAISMPEMLVVSGLIGLTAGAITYVVTGSVKKAVAVAIVVSIITFGIIYFSGLLVVEESAVATSAAASQEAAALQLAMQGAGREGTKELLQAMVQKLAQNPTLAKEMLKHLPNAVSPQAKIFLGYMTKILVEAGKGVEYMPPLWR